MGEVYRARDSRLKREVALKILPAEFAKDSSRRARFEQEAHAAAALNHPNIVALFDIGEHGGIAYYMQVTPLEVYQQYARAIAQHIRPLPVTRP
jgi:serine/threonine protein kinase